MSREEFHMRPIGRVATDAESVPRFYSVSDIEGALIIDEEYAAGLSDFVPGDRLNVIFAFHGSPPFDMRRLRIRTPHSGKERGVFSTRSPVRPNPIGLSIVEVLAVRGNIIEVRGLDMINGTPVLDIKPVDSSG